MESLIDLETVKLESGAHDSPEAGMCVMELASYLAHEPFSDHPACASGVISTFLQVWNDTLTDEPRQMLKPYASRVIGTAAAPEVERLRSLMALDWQIRTFLPAWLRLAKLGKHAQAVEALTPLIDDRPEVRAESARIVNVAGAAARDAAGDVAGAAARAAAGDALKPTVEQLQQSALALLDAMIEAR